KRDDRRDGGYRKRDDRRDGGYQRRDDRRDGGYQRRDDRREGGYQKRDDRQQYDGLIDRRPHHAEPVRSGRAGEEARAERPLEPRVPEGITGRELDKETQDELRGLSKE